MKSYKLAITCESVVLILKSEMVIELGIKNGKWVVIYNTRETLYIFAKWSGLQILLLLCNNR